MHILKYKHYKSNCASLINIEIVPTLTSAVDPENLVREREVYNLVRSYIVFFPLESGNYLVFHI